MTGVSLSGDAARDPAKLSAAALRLLDAGVRSWVFLHSPHGVFAANAVEQLWQPAVCVPLDQVKGTAGAGDALAAGVLFGLHEQWPVKRSLKLGVSAAATSLYDPSCSGSVKTAEECLSFADQLGFDS